jgi:hypothetical protein
LYKAYQMAGQSSSEAFKQIDTLPTALKQKIYQIIQPVGETPSLDKYTFSLLQRTLEQITIAQAFPDIDSALSKWISEGPIEEMEQRKEAEQSIKAFLMDQKATHLDLRDLKLSSLPAVFHLATAFKERLQTLTLSHNALKELPKEIGSCQALKKLNVADNQLNMLPALKDLPLETLDISSNQFVALPRVLWELSALSHLEVFGNPLLEEKPEDLLKLPPACGVFIKAEDLSTAAHRQLERAIQTFGDKETGVVLLPKQAPAHLPLAEKIQQSLETIFVLAGQPRVPFPQLMRLGEEQLDRLEQWLHICVGAQQRLTEEASKKSLATRMLHYLERAESDPVFRTTAVAIIGVAIQIGGQELVLSLLRLDVAYKCSCVDSGDLQALAQSLIRSSEIIQEAKNGKWDPLVEADFAHIGPIAAERLPTQEDRYRLLLRRPEWQQALRNYFPNEVANILRDSAVVPEGTTRGQQEQIRLQKNEEGMLSLTKRALGTLRLSIKEFESSAEKSQSLEEVCKVLLAAIEQWKSFVGTGASEQKRREKYAQMIHGLMERAAQFLAPVSAKLAGGFQSELSIGSLERFTAKCQFCDSLIKELIFSTELTFTEVVERKGKEFFADPATDPFITIIRQFRDNVSVLQKGIDQLTVQMKERGMQRPETSFDVELIKRGWKGRLEHIHQYVLEKDRKQAQAGMDALRKDLGEKKGFLIEPVIMNTPELMEERKRILDDLNKIVLPKPNLPKPK